MPTGYRTTLRPMPAEPKLLHGTPGTIYLLQNDSLREGVYKIGATRRSGTAKAMELNRDAHNMLPGNYECVFELHAKDCGASLEAICLAFSAKRLGKRHLDFFQFDLELASQTILSLVGEINSALLERVQLRQHYASDQKRHLLPDLLPDSLAGQRANNLTEPEQETELLFTAPTGLLQKAFQWVAA